MNNYNEHPWVKIPVCDIIKPVEGRICYIDRWWAVTDDNCALFYKSIRAPQCNRCEEIVKMLCKDVEVRFIPVAYLPIGEWLNEV